MDKEELENELNEQSNEIDSQTHDIMDFKDSSGIQTYHDTTSCCKLYINGVSITNVTEFDITIPGFVSAHHKTKPQNASIEITKYDRPSKSIEKGSILKLISEDKYINDNIRKITADNCILRTDITPEMGNTIFLDLDDSNDITLEFTGT
jgi:hypothetical protein